MPGVTTLPSNTLMIIGEADTINDVKLQLTKSHTLAGALVPGNAQTLKPIIVTQKLADLHKV
jgi:hypothetical protein